MNDEYSWQYQFFGGKCPYCDHISMYDSVIFSHCRKEHPTKPEGKYDTD